jgi:hypothetical protein
MRSVLRAVAENEWERATGHEGHRGAPAEQQKLGWGKLESFPRNRAQTTAAGGSGSISIPRPRSRSL